MSEDCLYRNDELHSRNYTKPAENSEESVSCSPEMENPSYGVEPKTESSQLGGQEKSYLKEINEGIEVISSQVSKLAVDSIGRQELESLKKNISSINGSAEINEIKSSLSALESNVRSQSSILMDRNQPKLGAMIAIFFGGLSVGVIFLSVMTGLIHGVDFNWPF